MYYYTNHKCIHPKTKVLLLNGTEKFASELQIGDALLGSNCDERIITKITNFKSTNYVVIPRFCNSSFIINESHYIPVNVDSRDTLINAKTFFKQSTDTKKTISLIHIPIELQLIPVTLEPYLLAFWLINNDNTNTIKLPKSNIPFLLFLLNFIEKFNLKYEESDDFILFTDHRLIKQFEKYDLFANPRIPNEYKYNNLNTRHRLIRGFLDNNDQYTIVLPNKNLKEDVCFVAHSLGYLTQSKRNNDQYIVQVFYNSNSTILQQINDFKVAEFHDDSCLCIELTGSSIGILLPDFTVI